MNIWHYSGLTGQLIGIDLARESPREPGQYLIPANATTLQPPREGPGLTAVFANGAWSLVEDHRGLTVYSKATGRPRKIEMLGPLPDDVTELGPQPDRIQRWDEATGAWVDDDEAIKARRILALKMELGDLDTLSIRALREFVVSKNGAAPQQLHDIEAEAELKRQELRDLEA